MLFAYSGTYKGTETYIVAKEQKEAEKWLQNVKVMDYCPVDAPELYVGEFYYLLPELVTKIH